MTYHSIYFLPFFIIFLMIYLLMPTVHSRQSIILLGSLSFYLLAGGFDSLVLLVITAAVVYYTSHQMTKIYLEYEQKKVGLTPKEQAAMLPDYKKRAKFFLWVGIIISLGILIYIKLGRLLHWKEVSQWKQLRFSTILIPLGISYYTFSSVGYLLDVYWRKVKCTDSFFNLLNCTVYFPIIVQGPISRYDRLLKQFNELPGFSYARVCHGLQLMLWGYFKKMVVADRLTLYTSTVFEMLNNYAGLEILFAVIGNALAIYADFSGCMDIVTGAAQTMGINLDRNFRQPFFSKNAAEFWRRWHITLGLWFKDYVYMPIAINPHFLKMTFYIKTYLGQRVGQVFTTAVPLMGVWILTGLWHGTGADYIAWGLYWGTIILLGTILNPAFKKMVQSLHIDTETFGFRFLQMLRTFGLFCIGRMLTAAGSLKGFVLSVYRLFSEMRPWVLFDGSLYTHGLDRKNFYVVLLGLALLLIVDVLQTRVKIRECLDKQPLVLRWSVYYAAIVSILVFGMYGSSYDASSFMYGNF